MPIVTDTEIIIRNVGRWVPSDVAYIRRVAFENWIGDSFDLVLLLLLQPRPPLSNGWPDPNGKFWEAAIGFEGVRDFSLTICGPSDFQTPGFALEDIRERQWEGLNLLVYDYEGLTKEGIQFAAKSAQVRSCQLAEFPPNSPNVWREFPGVFASSSKGLGKPNGLS